MIAGGKSNLIYEYAEYCYGAEEGSEDTVEYPMEYFFGAEHENTLVAEKSQLERQLYAQYPPVEVLDRCAVMKCFSDEGNKRISRMWTNIRCFDWTELF